MKKIIPIIALIGVGSFVAINSNKLQDKKDVFTNNINSFKEDLSDYTSLNQKDLTKTVFNKYNLSVLSDDLQNLDNLKENSTKTQENIEQTNLTNLEKDNNNLKTTDIQNEISSENNITKTPEPNLMTTELDESTVEESNDYQELEQNTRISTLYSLSNDIEDSCDDFCELKEEITEAIIETQKLINKIQNKELELTKEQRMFITEQSSQLKNLGRQLSNITTELSFHLSDLNQVMATKGTDIDSLNMKYLIVLDNLVNGNEMLQSSLNSINLINQMFNMQKPLPSNNQGRILYGFQQNNNEPIIKDYYIDENGDLIDNSNNKENTNEQSNSNDVAQEVDTKKNNTDTFQNRALRSNIDTFNNTHLPRNIDTFFNTALLDNEFMYGDRGYGYAGMNGMYGYANPYIQNYANYENVNSGYNANNLNNTLNQEQDYNSTNNFQNTGKEKKRIKLKKNIDTYKDENEPDIKTKLANIKNSISSFFGNFKQNDLKTDLSDKIDNPIYRFKAKNN